jgi:putative flippase GtrA
MSITEQSVCISLLIAITTAFITALLNNYYWQRQFKDAEKSEYRKLYHKRKLEIYEKLVLLIGEMACHLTSVVANMSNRAEASKAYDCFTESYIKILQFTISNGIYISGSIYQLTNALGPIKIVIDETFAKNSSSIDAEIKNLCDHLPIIVNAIREELGITTLLYGSEMQEILSKTRERAINA